MSIFDAIPSTFPFDVDLAERPVSFVLQRDVSECIVTVLLGLLWIILGPFLIYQIMDPWLSDPQTQTMAWWIMMAACSAFLVWAVFYYFGPEFLRLRRRVEVTITMNEVQTTERILFAKNNWSDSLDQFEGVAILNLGTQLIDDEKLPVASIILKHPDPMRSVPLTIRRKKQLGKKTLAKKATQMAVPVINEVLDVAQAVSYSPDTVVVNHHQALKVTLLYWASVAASALAFAIAAFQMVLGGVGPGIVIMIGISLTLAGLLHLYASLYVTQLRKHDGDILITTAALTRNQHKIPIEQITDIKTKRGKMNTRRHRVNTPFVTLRVEGQFLPFIIDMQSDYVVEKKLFALHLHGEGKNSA